MNLQLTGHHLNITPAIRSYVTSKLERITRHFDHVIDVTVILSVDNLPCELPVDASQHFGDALLRFVLPLARCDWSVPYDRLALPDELRRAVIVHRGSLTPPFAYLDPPVTRNPWNLDFSCGASSGFKAAVL